MGETTTLHVPSEHTQAFRLAAAHEIGFDAKYVAERQRELVAAISDRDHPDALELRRQLDAMRDGVAILEQLCGGPEDDHEVVSDNAELLAHVAEAMAREVVGPNLAEALSVGPIDAEQKQKIDALQDALSWATEKSEHLHRVAWEQREEVLA